VAEGSPLCVVRLREKRNKDRGRFVLLVRREAEDPKSNDHFPYLALSIVRTRFLGIFESCPFFDWSIVGSDVSSIDTSTYEFEHSCLLLPSFAEFGVPVSMDGFFSYYTVTSEWFEMISDGTFARGEYYNNTTN
jgi:hypothetical protein